MLRISTAAVEEEHDDHHVVELDGTVVDHSRNTSGYGLRRDHPLTLSTAEVFGDADRLHVQRDEAFGARCWRC